MVEKEVLVTNQLGIHARPAILIVDVASSYAADVQLINGDTEVDAKSIMSVLLLKATKGTRITVRASGDDEQAAVGAVVELIEGGFPQDTEQGAEGAANG